MRYEEMKLLLDGRTSPELSNLLSSIDTALVDAGFTMHRDELDHALGIESEIDSTTVVDNVVDVLRVACSKVLAIMEIEVSDQIPLQRLYDLVAYLTTFGVTDDSQNIYDMIQNREDNETLLCDIMELVSEHDSGDYLPYISTVGTKLVEMMEKIISDGFEVEEEPLQDVTPIVQRLAGWEGEKPVIATMLDEQNVPMGASMESLMTIYGDVMADMPPKKAMDNLVYLSLYSDTENDALVDEVEFRMEGLYDSVDASQDGLQQLRKHKPSLESLAGDPNA